VVLAIIPAHLIAWMVRVANQQVHALPVFQVSGEATANLLVRPIAQTESAARAQDLALRALTTLCGAVIANLSVLAIVLQAVARVLAVACSNLIHNNAFVVSLSFYLCCSKCLQ